MGAGQDKILAQERIPISTIMIKAIEMAGTVATVHVAIDKLVSISWVLVALN